MIPLTRQTFTALTLSLALAAPVFAAKPWGTDQARALAAQTPLAPGKVIASQAPLGSTDHIRQIQGRELGAKGAVIQAHQEPAGTTDAVRQLAGSRHDALQPGIWNRWVLTR